MAATVVAGGVGRRPGSGYRERRGRRRRSRCSARRRRRGERCGGRRRGRRQRQVGAAGGADAAAPRFARLRSSRSATEPGLPPGLESEPLSARSYERPRWCRPCDADPVRWRSCRATSRSRTRYAERAVPVDGAVHLSTELPPQGVPEEPFNPAPCVSRLPSRHDPVATARRQSRPGGPRSVRRGRRTRSFCRGADGSATPPTERSPRAMIRLLMPSSSLPYP